MQLHGHDLVAPHCFYAQLIVRFVAPLSTDKRTSAMAALVAAGVLEAEEENEGEHEQEQDASEPTSDSQFLTGTWLPRDGAEAAKGFAAIAELEASHGAVQGWVMSVNTQPNETDEDEDEDEAEDESEDEAALWQHGPPPSATETPFALEGYPDIIEAFDWQDFGIALKLDGPPVPGEHEVLCAAHRIWLSHYINEGAEEAPFRNTAATFDPVHRSVMIWVDRFTAAGSEEHKVHHLIEVINQIHQIVPIAHARFDEASMELKYAGLNGDTQPPFVLAGNPLGMAFEEGGETAAVAWAEEQRRWSKKELAAMYVEVGMHIDPDDAEAAPAALRSFDRAAALDPDNVDATAYAQVVLTRSGAPEQALQRAERSKNPGLVGYTFGLVAEHATEHIAAAAALVSKDVLAELDAKTVGEIVAAVGEHHVSGLPALLAALPRDTELITPLVHAGDKLDPALRLKVLQAVLAQEVPSDDDADRGNYVQTLNNACILAQEIKDYPLAKEIADRAQPYTTENPFIFHSAACAYVAVGELDAAMKQVEGAVEHHYDHLKELEEDVDLGELRTSPQFKALFAAWRERQSLSEPVGEANEDDFGAQVLEHASPVLVDFTASWCGPCKRQSPILDQVAAQSQGRYRVIKVDIDACPGLAERYDASSVPTLVVFRGGEERARTSGLSGLGELKALLAGGGV